MTRKKKEVRCRTWMELRLREFLKKKKSAQHALMCISKITYLVENYHPDVYCYIIPTNTFSPYDKKKEKYVFVFYTMINSVEYMFVSDTCFDNLEEAKYQLHYYISYYPLFSFLPRNILRESL